MIHNPISLIELCDQFSLLIVVDDKNIIYLIEFNKFELIREINFNGITKSKQVIKFICICGLTGDFVIVTNYMAVLFNLNGVLIGSVNIKEYDYRSRMGKITYALVKSLKNTESEIHLFTGHENGSLFMWRLQINKIIIEESLNNYGNFSYNLNNNIFDDVYILDSYRFAYSKKYYYQNYKNNYDLRFKFDLANEFTHTKKNIPLRMIKLTEDSSMLITIHDDMSLTYWNYADFLAKKNKTKVAVKNCPQCNSSIGSSKYHCSLCDKKLCSQCKIEVKFII